MRVPAPTAPTEADDSTRPSKTRLKQQMHALQQLGADLTALSADRLAALEMPDRLRDAIAEYQRTRSHEGRRRQMQFIGKLMRTVDAEPLQAAVDAQALGPAIDALQLHEAERWRMQLVGSDDAIAQWSGLFPDSDATHLRRLVLAARRDAALPPEQRHGRAWRELFRFIKPHLAKVSA